MVCPECRAEERADAKLWGSEHRQQTSRLAPSNPGDQAIPLGQHGRIEEKVEIEAASSAVPDENTSTMKSSLPLKGLNPHAKPSTPRISKEEVYSRALGVSSLSTETDQVPNGPVTRKKRSNVSTLKCYLANITSASKDAIDHLKNSSQYDVIGAAETHVRDSSATKLVQNLEIAC